MKDRGTPELLLSVERYGSSGPHMLLIHGLAASTFTWRHWIPVLEQDYRVIAVDLKGHGAAPAPRDQAYRPSDHVDSLIELLRWVDPAELILVGHSMGGGIALLLALRLIDERPGLLRAMVLVSGAAYPQPLPPFVRLARKGWLSRVLFGLLPKRPLIRKVLQSIVFDTRSVSEDQVEAYAGPMRRGAHRRALLETARQIVPPDLPALSRRFGEIPVPTLALWGRTDNVVPLATGRRLEREMADARLVILEECGHIPPEERPDESMQEVLDFLTDVAEVAPSVS